MKFNDVKSSIACIYRITFPDGKFYVGMTKNLKDRMRLYERLLGDLSNNSRVMCALREFGVENVDIDILRSVTGLSGDDLSLCLSILEIKYIREQDCIYPNGYNTSIGGELLGIPTDVIETSFGVDATGYAGKSILVYDKDGNFVKEYSSVARCAYGLGVNEKEVSAMIDKRGRLLKSAYMLRERRYGEIPKKILPFEPEVVVKHRVKTEYDIVTEKVFRKKDIGNAAIMYDANGEYVGLFDSHARSKKYLGLRADWKIPYGREFRGYYILHYNGGEIKKSLGAFTSSVLTTIYYDDVLALGDIENIGEAISFQMPEEEKPQKRVKEIRAVNKYELDGEYIESYGSISEASLANSISDGSIRSCCNRVTNTSGGYIFRYADDDKPVVGRIVKPKVKQVVHVRTKPRIEKYTLDGKYIHTYESAVEAAEAENVYSSAILACANKKVRRCGGYIYRFEGDSLDLPEFDKITLSRYLSSQKGLLE